MPRGIRRFPSMITSCPSHCGLLRHPRTDLVRIWQVAQHSLGYQDGGWRQYHHHGSIDDPAALRAYQQAIQG
jgi:hypothetical protein